MALVVEDGTGKPDAESYDSVAGISATLALTGENAAWTALASDTVREQVARRVFRAIDNENSFRGEKKTAEQAGEWPRVNAYDDDGFLYSDTAIPIKLKTAFALLCAEASVPGADLQPTQTEPGMLASKSIGLGKLTISKTWVGGQSPIAYRRKAESLLAELVESSDVMVRA
jgi:hypothetical protein